MKIALLGFGAMGQLVSTLAQRKGYEIGVKITSDASNNSLDQLVSKLHGHDVAIDFSVGDAVARHVDACSRAQLPLVEGTTGWKEQEPRVRELILERKAALVYGANFSIGVNVFYRIVEHAASLFAAVDGYESFIEEAHHSRKRDAPSGTALRLHDLMAEKLTRQIPISSTRAGHIPGTHRVGFDSAADHVVLTHMARSREGFAEGALLAARWIIGRQGVFQFSEVIEEILRSRTK